MKGVVQEDYVKRRAGRMSMGDTNFGETGNNFVTNLITKT